MKKLLYALVVLITIAGCRSIEKLVERGEYDEAIVLAARKLSGKKKKKTSHVKALERAFAKITAEDMRRIESLDAKNNPEHWTKVLAIGNKIERRQNRVSPFLPLISKDNYAADFRFVDTGKLINEALDGSAAYHYNLGLRRLNEAIESNDYLRAREAFGSLEKVESYRADYRDTRMLMERSRELGIADILLNFSDSNIFNYHDEIFLSELNALGRYDINSFWKIYHFEFDSSKNYDVIMNVELLHTEISPERELVDRHTDSKKIKDGWEYIKDEEGQIKTDSLGNRLKRDVYKFVEARITEVFREKTAFAAIKISAVDVNNRDLIYDQDLEYENVFSDRAARFRGDRRAVCDNDIKFLKGDILPFPNDLDMIADTAYKMKDMLVERLRKLNV